jgi:hypothetical protein
LHLEHPYNRGLLFPAASSRYDQDIVNVMPDEIAHIIGCGLEAQANIKIVVFSTIDPAAKAQARLEEISRQEGKERLLAYTAPTIQLPGSQFSPHLAPFFVEPSVAGVAEQIELGSRQARFFCLKQCFQTFRNAAAQLTRLACSGYNIMDQQKSAT